MYASTQGSFVFDILNLDISSSITMLLQRSAIALSRRAIVTAPVVAQRNFSLIPAYFRSKIVCTDVEPFKSLFWGALLIFFSFVCLGDGKSAVKTGETTDSTAPVPVKTSVAFKGMGFLNPRWGCLAIL